MGYFLTAVKDFSKKSDRRPVRALHQSLGPPQGRCRGRALAAERPIIFWIEKTVPFDYRKPIRDGILEWNKAFEKAGFANAIEVRQQPDDADLGSGRHQLQHLPLDHRRRRLCHGPVAA